MGSGGVCADGRGLTAAAFVTVSPDGKHVHVASLIGNALAAFARDEQTGALSQLPGLDGCVSETGLGGCANGKALVDNTGLAVTRDGKHVYLASWGSHAVAVFARDGW
jgi:DNA-binding beta-propeller fold protein YncE